MKWLCDLPKVLCRNTFQMNNATLHIYMNISNSHIWYQNIWLTPEKNLRLKYIQIYLDREPSLQVNLLVSMNRA